MPYDIVLSVWDLYRENWRFRDRVSWSRSELSSRVERYRVFHSDSQLFAEKYMYQKKG